MIWLVFFIIGVLWIAWNAVQMPTLRRGDHAAPFVSILIPLRNEEERVKALIENLQQLRYENVEILLYDDDSTDETASLIKTYTLQDPRFQFLCGQALPAGWKGKPHACMHLANEAKGDLFLFLDADVTLAIHTVEALVATMEKYDADAVSGFPNFKYESFLEKLLTPLLHFFVYMHLPIRLANGQKMPLATAASGAFIAISRQCYFDVGGHELVKNTIVEDVTFFREIKKKGHKAYIFHVADFVQCSMYGSSKATWEGFLKNCFEAFGNSYRMAVVIVLFYGVYFVLPAFLVVYGIVHAQWVFIIPYVCITIQRLISDGFSRQLNTFTLFMPVSAFFYCLLLITAMAKRLFKQKNSWKGRTL